jgi:NAD(P)H-dependent FMN reductase
MGTTNGPFGTWRATPMYRQMYASLGAIVLPQSFNLPNAQNVWDESGQLVDEKLPDRVQKFVAQFLSMVRQLHRDN